MLPHHPRFCAQEVQEFVVSHVNLLPFFNCGEIIPLKNGNVQEHVVPGHSLNLC